MMDSKLILPFGIAVLISLSSVTEIAGTNGLCDDRTCSSRNFAYAQCSSNKAYVTISLTRKLSRSACDRDKSFGLNQRGLWVSKGCSGSFKVCQCSSTYQLDCDSNGFRYAECHVNNPSAIFSVKVVHKRSSSACTPGISFGNNHKGLWVDKGCRARFEVCRCTSTKLVNCDSFQFKYAQCTVQAPRGILRVTVDHRRSSSACVYGTSFGIKGSGIWVDKGCRAAFDVCLN